MKQTIKFGKWLALQPMQGKVGGYDRGTVWEIHQPWMTASKGEWEAKPYLSVIPIEQIMDSTMGCYQPHVYPFNHSVFKMFLKLKDERNWFKEMCDHDLDYHCKEDYAKCKKCDFTFKTYPNDPNNKSGGCWLDTSRQEAVAFRNQFGFPLN